jgi:hypothetical protein
MSMCHEQRTEAMWSGGGIAIKNGRFFHTSFFIVDRFILSFSLHFFFEITNQTGLGTPKNITRAFGKVQESDL